jgi:hypothetical protein
VHAKHHTWGEKLWAGLRFAFGELWGDLAGWFLVGLVLAGIITALVPPEVMTRYLGGGLSSLLLMLVIGIPLYICATASTPIAAALIMGGVSPGAALVFLLVGPATNITSLTMLLGLLGKRATAIYLAGIAVFALLCGLALDQVYPALGLNPQAVMGRAGGLIPLWAKWIGALVLLAISVKPVWRSLWARFGGQGAHVHGAADRCGHDHEIRGGDAMGGALPLVGASGPQSGDQCSHAGCGCSRAK